MKIIEGNCLDVLKEMETSSVDICFYDPPYNVKKDYGVYKDNLSPEEYEKFMQEVISETRRISRKGIVVYVGGKLTKLFYSLIPDAHLIIVHKRAAGVFSGNYMLQYHSMFSTVKPVIKCKDLWDDVRLPGEGYYFREKRYDHPGLTGLDLTRKVLQHFSVEGDIVLDPFAGTGTTGVAALEMKRDFIGVEMNPKYIEVAKERMEGILV